VDFLVYIVLAGVIGAAVVLRADLRRRRLRLTQPAGWHVLTVLDVAGPTLTLGLVCGLLVSLVPVAVAQGVVPLRSPAPWAILAGILILVFLWSEGQSQIQFQRPRGIVFGEWLILAGACQLLESYVFGGFSGMSHGLALNAFCGLTILAGALVIARVVPPFLKKGEERHILDRLVEQGESVQKEYTAPTPECPHPELWKMMDSQTSELEVLDFLRSLVMTIKPQLIVETGTFLGYGTLKMAEGLKENGFGRIITIEYDPAIFAQAKERIEASGLGSWIENRNESSLDTRIDGTIDFLYSDSELNIREQEIRKFLPQLDARGLIAVHDASSHFAVVREGALRLEQEGLISVIMLSTPRGLVLAQKREGRK
jgi:predicted O-methyltransferase YrrM